MRRPAAASQPRPRVASTKSFPTLVRGWIANAALSTPEPGGAARLENFFPTATDVRMRGGSALYVTMGNGEIPVASMFTYINGAVRQLFAALPSSIFDITTVTEAGFVEMVDEDENQFEDEDGNEFAWGGAAGLEKVTGQTGGYWSSVQFQTPGGIFLRLVNGEDTPLVYDGADFSTSPAITGTGLDPADLIFVWAYKRRLFFIEKDSMNAWYLDVEAIGGAATKLPLGANFSRGGSLLFGSSWSLSTGDGLSEQCAFMSTEGEVAIFQGDNPGDTATWTKVGVYQIGRPLGSKAFVRGGGDLIISTDIGFLPLSSAIQRDAAAMAPAAVSYPIEDEWNERVRLRSTKPWHAETWPTQQMVMIALPSTTGAKSEMLVANARTGAWALYTGWDGTCLGLFGDRMFFGSTGGRVIEAEVGGLDVALIGDETTPYTAIAAPLFDGLKNPTAIKEAGLARAVVRAPGEVVIQVTAHADFVLDLPPPPDAVSQPGGSIWGAGVWGSSTWGTEQARLTEQTWESVSAIGFALTAAVQITSGSLAAPGVSLVRIDMTYQVGDL